MYEAAEAYKIISTMRLTFTPIKLAQNSFYDNT